MKLKKEVLKILELINNYSEVHPSAIECGAEYINQDDGAQIDAIELVCDIFDIISKESVDRLQLIRHKLFGHDMI